MTREEFAKKKGINLPKTEPQTAAEAFLTTMPENREDSKAEIETAKTEQPKQCSQARAGRPKGKPSTKVSLNIPNEYMDLVSVAAGIGHRGNTSAYIVSLIEKDIEANGKVYNQVKEMAK